MNLIINTVLLIIAIILFIILLHTDLIFLGFIALLDVTLLWWNIGRSYDDDNKKEKRCEK